jgi:hypothetical protein
MTRYEPSEKNFKYLNEPLGRHGQDDSSLCYICGERVEPRYVFCSPHHRDWYKYRKSTKGSHDWMKWVINHPDFNGIDFDGQRRMPHRFPHLPTAEDTYLTLRIIDP